MLRWTVPVMFGLLASGCDEGGGGGATAGSAGSAGSATRAGSGAGFSADLAKQIGGSGDGSAGAVESGNGSAAGSAMAGSAVGSGSGSAARVGAGAGSAVGAVSAVGAGSAVATRPNSGSGSAVGSGAGSASKVGTGSAAGSAAGSASAKVPSVPVVVPPPVPSSNLPRVPVKPSPELAAIKLSLSPNWDRDVGEAGTISLAVKLPGRTDTKVFAFRYGYEDAKAPADRDAYKKWLADNKILTASLDRQRGAAWYLEGVDGSGAPVFRIVVTFGGRKLICGGSLYKDAASNQLGDIRDKTIIQAKEICETVAL